ncbi:MAG: methylmalonyl Co-A mutase-associated GTPase MeaB, partial [Anaerolineae bacterium]|nr:methylmalonyl Co-A mutase-associated GTPase MeaB [Anaerolineae bacterium]
PGVFIRSMASRGRLGGLARSTAEVILALDAAGFQRILVETVGVGQAEVDIARTGHTTVVVRARGRGDDIQAIKAGILEAADVLVINKADHEGVERTESALRTIWNMGASVLRRGRATGEAQVEAAAADWVPPIVRTVATQGEGVVALVDAIERHVAHLRETGSWHRRERERMAFALREVLQDELMARLLASLPRDALEAQLQKVVERVVDPYSAAVTLLTTIIRSDKSPD